MLKTQIHSYQKVTLNRKAMFRAIDGMVLQIIWTHNGNNKLRITEKKDSIFESFLISREIPLKNRITYFFLRPNTEINFEVDDATVYNIYQGEDIRELQYRYGRGLFEPEYSVISFDNKGNLLSDPVIY